MCLGFATFLTLRQWHGGTKRACSSPTGLSQRSRDGVHLIVVSNTDLEAGRAPCCVRRINWKLGNQFGRGGGANTTTGAPLADSVKLLRS